MINAYDQHAALASAYSTCTEIGYGHWFDVEYALARGALELAEYAYGTFTRERIY